MIFLGPHAPHSSVRRRPPPPYSAVLSTDKSTGRVRHPPACFTETASGGESPRRRTVSQFLTINNATAVTLAEAMPVIKNPVLLAIANISSNCGPSALVFFIQPDKKNYVRIPSRLSFPLALRNGFY